MSLECTSQYSCYGSTIHAEKLKSLKITCSEFWSCAYLKIEGSSSLKVSVEASEENGYYALGSAEIYCPNDDSVDSKCSVSCDGERSCFHTKLYFDGEQCGTCNMDCNGQLSCKYASINCNYDSSNELWLNSCSMSCSDDYSCKCDDNASCI